MREEEKKRREGKEEVEALHAVPFASVTPGQWDGQTDGRSTILCEKEKKEKRSFFCIFLLKTIKTAKVFIGPYRKEDPTLTKDFIFCYIWHLNTIYKYIFF